MSQNTQWDSLDYQVLNFPYNRIETEFSPKPRLFRGLNAYITRGGKLAKRPGTLDLDDNNAVDGRIDRLWSYETLNNPPEVYFLASVFNGSVWELWYKHITEPVSGWVMADDYRDINESTRPHEMAVSRGLAYVKGYPSDVSTEKLGSVIFNGFDAAATVQPWGILGPQLPAEILGGLTTLTTDVTSSATTIDVAGLLNFPSAPFLIQVGYEQMEVTVGPPSLAWTVTRGYNGTVATEHFFDEPVIYLDWSTSSHIVEVNYGWTYSYAYKSITGQVSNRAPIQTNPDRMPSFTGPFFDLCPVITVQGHADTTNIPTICIYRTTDGGGTFFKLAEIDNTGAGDIEFTDNELESGFSGGDFDDPIPDSVLDQFDLGPDLYSNSPPPTVLLPEVTGIDTPDPTTPLVVYQSRIWYAIGNVLFYSAQEELAEGIPEESFPSGAANGRNGNFFRFQFPIVNLAETNDALYVFTLQSTYVITGTNRETFSFSPAFENYGGPPGQPRAIARYGDTIAFLTHDYRVCLIKGTSVIQVSDPLWTDLVDAINQAGQFDIKYFADLDKEWVVVTCHRQDAPSLSSQWVYDIKKSKDTQDDFWYVPWDIHSVACLSARASNTSSQRRLIFAIFDPDEYVSALVRIDPTGRTGTDYFFGEEQGFSFVAETHQMLVPAGNHVNDLRKPALTPRVYSIEIDRMRFANDFDPDVYYYKDSLWVDPIQTTEPVSPPRRDLSQAYKTLIYGVNEVSQHFAIRIAKINSTDLFECLRLQVTWDPDGGS